MAYQPNNEGESLVLIKDWFKSHPGAVKRLFGMPMEDFVRLANEYKEAAGDKPSIKTAVATVIGSWVLSSSTLKILEPSATEKMPTLTSVAMYFDIPKTELCKRVNEYRDILLADCGILPDRHNK